MDCYEKIKFIGVSWALHVHVFGIVGIELYLVRCTHIQILPNSPNAMPA